MDISDKTLTRNTEDFNFVDTVADIASNKSFVEGFVDYKNLKDNEKSFIWKALQEIGGDISNTIYENILNYIENVGNIDTCKVRALFSMSNVLGVSNNGIDSVISKMPDEILRLLDLFSINRSFGGLYKINGETLRTTLKDIALSSLSVELSNAKRHAADANGGFDEKTLSSLDFDALIPREDYRKFISMSFGTALSDNLFNTYTGVKWDEDSIESTVAPDGLTYPIYDVLNDSRNKKDVDRGCFAGLKSDLENPAIQAILDLYNLKNFDPYKIADDIDSGKDLEENYKDVQANLLDLVFKDRHAPLSAAIQTTKYAYYHRKGALDYLKFIDAVYDCVTKGEFKKSLGEWVELYDVDSKYFNVTSAYLADTKSGILDSRRKIKTETLSVIADTLADMAIAISNIREKLKTQAQRNYMRGTFLLISYIVSEYLKHNLLPTYKQVLDGRVIQALSSYQHLSGENTWNVDITEYIDTTEYYNLSTDTSPAALSGNTVNYRFWEDDSEDFTGIGLAMDDIDQFYLHTLNLKTSTKNVSSFLNVIYELGADRGYIDRRTGLAVPGVVADDIYDQVEANWENFSANYYAISSYQKNILLSYGGTKISYDPYYNWKNMAHPSYQIHPYLYRFVEYSDMSYAIKSSYGGNSNEEVLEALKTSAISTILGEMGNTINIWDRNAVDSSGWKSRYENNTHNQNTNYDKVSPLQHYDGVFYPSAIEDYVSALTSGGLSDVNNDAFRFLSSTIIGELTASKITEAVSVYMYTKVDRGTRRPWKLSTLTRQSDDGEKEEIPLLPFEQISAINEDQPTRHELDFKEWFREKYVNPVVLIHDADVRRKDELADEKDRKAAEREYRGLIKHDFGKTFYDKWYSHLKLSLDDRIKIAKQLGFFAKDIYDLYKSRPVSEETFDIYKYGIDKYSNSILLYKKYHLSATKKVKDDTPGELWLRFNSHPIGFPMFRFGGEELKWSMSQIETGEGQSISEELDEILEHYQNEEDKIVSCFYDFDRTNDYKYFVFAYSLKSNRPYSKLQNFLTIKPREDPYKYEHGEYVNSYHWDPIAENMVTVRSPDIDPESGDSKEVFQGIYQFQNSDSVYLMWATLLNANLENEDRQIIRVSRIRLPFYLTETMDILCLNEELDRERVPADIDRIAKGMKYIAIPRRIISQDLEYPIRLGYICGDGGGWNTLAFMVESASQFIGQNYIGLNSKFDNESEEMKESYESETYGQMDYLEQTREIKEDDGSDPNYVKNYNSFDRLENDLYLVSFNDSYYTGYTREITNVRQYNLNSDASFIPLYEGLQGFIRIWAADFYSKNDINSIELLGPTFNNLRDLSSDFLETLFDDNGTLTRLDPISLLSSSFRVYEQYARRELRNEQGEFIGMADVADTHYASIFNDVLTMDNFKFRWEIPLEHLDLANGLNNYKILFYNVNRGANCPIIATDLSNIGQTSAVHYISSGTNADNYYLSNRYIHPYFADTAGTPPVLVSTFNAQTAAGETNYIMGVSAVQASLDVANKKLIITMDNQDEVINDFVNTREMLIDKNSLLVMVYDLNLKEFDDIHFMHHHLEIPFTSVLNKGAQYVRGSVAAADLSVIELSNYRGQWESPLDMVVDEEGKTANQIAREKIEKTLDYISALTPDAEANKQFLSVITEGSYSFKIGEQMQAPMKFPPGKHDDTLKDLFKSINKNISELSNIFKNDNTYVFELHRPAEIAAIMREIEISIYGDDGEFILVNEEWVHDMYHVSKYRTPFAGYIAFFEEDNPGTSDDYGNNETSPALPPYGDEDALGYFIDETLNPEGQDPTLPSYGLQTTEEGFNPEFAIDSIYYKVEEEKIKDFLKLYVNWAKDDNGGIHLFFNYNNFFNSPYTYRNSNGVFATEYKPNTYLHLLPPGEKDGDEADVGDLNIIIQLKYYNYMGTICGVKNVPVINYTIKNISDDKPKFSIINTWCTSELAMELSRKKEIPIVETSAWMRVGWNHLGYDEENPEVDSYLSKYLMQDYTTSEDLSAKVEIRFGSECCRVGSITADIVYEYTDENIEIIEEECTGGIFNFSKNGIINVRTTTSPLSVAFKLKKGSIIDEDTLQLRVPVDAINFRAKTEDMTNITHTKTSLGGLIFDFRTADGFRPEKYFALEKRTNPQQFNGFELSENKKLIKIFQNKKYEEEE